MSDTIPKSRPKTIALSSIRENPSALRPVNKQSEEYQGLLDSVRQRGIMNPIVVREVKDGNGTLHYGLVDGLHRFTAAQDAGMQEVPANVISLNDAEVLEAQILTNLHKVDTKPVQYTKQLMRILSSNPLMLISELAKRLSVSPGWLNDRLGLVNLNDKIAALVDDNKIGLSNAYALAKLPEEEQQAFVERAMTMTPQEFVPTVNSRVKQIKDLKRQGRDPNQDEFVPVAHMRKISEINNEVESHTVAKALIAEAQPKNAEEAFILALQWVRHMDPLSVQSAKQEHLDRKAKEKSDREDRKAKREQEKKEKAELEAADISKL